MTVTAAASVAHALEPRRSDGHGTPQPFCDWRQRPADPPMPGAGVVADVVVPAEVVTLEVDSVDVVAGVEVE